MEPFEYKRQNMAVWNEMAPRYHTKWAGADSGPFQSTRELVDMVGVKGGDRVLDVACGTGAVTRRLAVRVGGSGCVVGTDMSVSAIRIARRNNREPNVLFVNADAENLPLVEGFDVVTCQYALFFFPDASRALKNMRSNLDESGVLGVSVHGCNVPYYTSILDAITEFIPDYVAAGAPRLDRYGTAESLKGEVEGAGFSDVQVREFVFTYSPGDFEQYWRMYLEYVSSQAREKINSLGEMKMGRLREAVRKNAGPYENDGVMRFPWQVLILTARY